jgi:chemotaxis protein MotB
MFAEGQKEPFERTRRLIQQLAGALRAMPFRISIAGHTAALKAPTLPGYGPWDLPPIAPTVAPAPSRRRADRPHLVAGKADTQPLFPDDPYIATNRRVTITDA